MNDACEYVIVKCELNETNMNGNLYLGLRE